MGWVGTRLIVKKRGKQKAENVQENSIGREKKIFKEYERMKKRKNVNRVCKDKNKLKKF